MQMNQVFDKKYIDEDQYESVEKTKPRSSTKELLAKTSEDISSNYGVSKPRRVVIRARISIPPND